MIHRATDRRCAGDWQGACAAADVAVDIDLPAVARRHGAHLADQLEQDLRHLAPDLLRWHLQRLPGTGKTALSPRRLSVLARYDDGIALLAGSPRAGYGRQQLQLFVTVERPALIERGVVYGDGPGGSSVWHDGGDLSGQRHLWDARRAGELLTHYGLDRVSGFGRDGRPVQEPVTATETLIERLQDTGFLEEAWDLVGVDVPPVSRHRGDVRRMVTTSGFWCRLPALVREIRRVAAETGSDLVTARFGSLPFSRYSHYPFVAAFERATAERMRLTFELVYENRDERTHVVLDRFGVPVDALLLRLGLLTPDELHPLVHAAFFPNAAAPPAGPPGPPPPQPVRVRCRGEWHEVRMQGGTFHLPHDEEERRRESALEALGGTVSGCFAVAAQWRSGTGRLPRGLRAQRRELMLRAVHGDADGVTALLDAGVDPHVRDDRGRTLLHLMAHLHDPGLLQRLLAAGLDVDARDLRGLTPLFCAVHGMGDLDLVRALLDAGARPDLATDESGSPIAEWARRARPTDLHVLLPLLEEVR
jgi:hypothetical protein